MALSGSALAQEPSWIWGKGFSEGVPSNPFADETGHTFFQYHFNDTALVNGETYTEVNGLGLLLATLDANGSYVDVQQLAFDPGTLSPSGPGNFHFERWFTDSLVLPDSVMHIPGHRGLAYGQMNGAGTISAIEVIALIPIVEYPDPMYNVLANMLLRANGNVAVLATVPDSIHLANTTIHVDTSSLVVAEFTPTGTLLWTTVIAKGEAMRHGNLDEDLDGTLYLTGACTHCLVGDTLLTSPGGIWHIDFAAKLRAGGQWRLLWTDSYMINAPTLLAGAADRFYLGVVNSYGSLDQAVASVLCVDTAGAPLWNNSLTDPGAVLTTKLEYDAQHRVIASANSIGDPWNHRFKCIDSTGAVQWTKDIDQGENLFGASIYPDPYGCYFVTGKYQYGVTLDSILITDQDTNNRGAFLANLCALTVGLDDPATSELRTTAWPNPVEGTLHLSIPPGLESLVRILDPQGRAVLRPFTLRSAAVIDVSSLCSGMYFISTENGATRFIKE